MNNNDNPTILFSPNFILSIYNILTYQDFVSWINNNKKVELKTRLRVFISGLHLYKDYINLLDENMIFLFKDLLHYHINDIYNELHIYLNVKNGKVIVANDKNDRNIDAEIKKKYISDKLITFDFINKFYTKLINYDIDNIHKEYINFIKHKIIKKLNNSI